MHESEKWQWNRSVMSDSSPLKHKWQMWSFSQALYWGWDYSWEGHLRSLMSSKPFCAAQNWKSILCRSSKWSHIEEACTGESAPSVRVINLDIAYSYTKTSGTPRLKRVGNSDIQWLAGCISDVRCTLSAKDGIHSLLQRLTFAFVFPSLPTLWDSKKVMISDQPGSNQ